MFRPCYRPQDVIDKARVRGTVLTLAITVNLTRYTHCLNMRTVGYSEVKQFGRAFFLFTGVATIYMNLVAMRSNHSYLS